MRCHAANDSQVEEMAVNRKIKAVVSAQKIDEGQYKKHTILLQ